jgi:hypothetical protein
MDRMGPLILGPPGSGTVKNVGGLTGNTGIEVLPVVPVVRKGMDQVGRELIGMIHEWVDWIGEKSGRVSVRKLSGMSGRESENETEGPSFRNRVFA